MVPLLLSATDAVLSVPGAAGGAPRPAPMFSVPVDVPLPTVTDPLFTSPPFAMVSTPPFLTLSVPVFQVEPAPSTVTVRVPVPAPTKGLLPIIALLSLTVPPVLDDEYARPRGADNEVVAGVGDGPRGAGPVHRYGAEARNTARTV